MPSTAHDRTGDEGYRKAEVTSGGIALDEVDPRTLESRRAPGLYLGRHPGERARRPVYAAHSFSGEQTAPGAIARE